MNNCVCKININGTEYNIKDSEARELIATLTEQLGSVNTSISGFNATVTEVNNKFTNISETINEHIENAFSVSNETLVLGGEQ